jgi:hypothetical protein
MNAFLNKIGERWAQWLINDYPPEEFVKSDARLKGLNIGGPHGSSHDRLRRAFVAISSGQTQGIDKNKLYFDHSYVCNRSPGLWNRTQDDTPKELQIVCSTTADFLDLYY